MDFNDDKNEKYKKCNIKAKVTSKALTALTGVVGVQINNIYSQKQATLEGKAYMATDEMRLGIKEKNNYKGKNLGTENRP